MLEHRTHGRRDSKPEGLDVLTRTRVTWLVGDAEDGPSRCSGLPTRRYSARALEEELGVGFRLLADAREEHGTPSGGLQPFNYCLLERLADVDPHDSA
jgi:hypothetical protein